MHVCTVIKVRANNEEEAIDKVNGHIEESFREPFDWWNDGGAEIVSEEDYNKAIKGEEDNLMESLKKYQDAKSKNDDMWRYYLLRAGEAAFRDELWSTERFAFDMDWEDGKNTYFVRIDRHY